MPRATKLPENILALTEDLTVPAIADADIASLARLADASPEDFQRAMAGLFRRLATEGFRTLQAPRNLKEMATVIDLWRKMEGLDKPSGGSNLPSGLVGVMRSVQRRVVVEAEPVEGDEVGFE